MMISTPLPNTWSYALPPSRCPPVPIRAVRYLVLGLLLTVTCKLTMDYYINNHMVATTDGRDAQLRERMEHTLQALLAPGKGILAADESLPTMSRRFEQVRTELYWKGRWQ